MDKKVEQRMEWMGRGIAMKQTSFMLEIENPNENEGC